MRNLVALIALAIGLAVVPARVAHATAGDPGNMCPSNAANCTKAAAYADCMARQQAVQASGMGVANPVYHCNGGTSNPSGAWTPYTQGSNGYYVMSDDIYTHSCDGTATYNDTTHQCFSSSECLAHNAEPGFKGVGDTVRESTATPCVSGCEFKAVPASSAGGTVSVGLPNSGGKFITSGKWEFTGNACAAAAPVKTPAQAIAENDQEQACVPAGSGQTFCLKKDGQHCASASNGREICWRPTETGEKTDKNILQKRSPGDTALPPKTPPPDGTTLAQTGTPINTTTTVTNTTNTSTTTNTTTTNYTTNTGTDAGSGTDSGQPATGTGGTSGTCAASDPSCAGAAGGVKDGTGLYTKTDKTVASVYGTFKTGVQGSPLVSAAGNFFGSCSGSGTCPAATWSAETYGIAFDLSSMCSGSLLTLLQLAGYVMLAAAGIYAFKIALL